MPSSAKSASRTDGREDRALVVGVNWLGDAIMAMPALQAFQAANPACSITLLSKPGLVPLWNMHGAPSDVVTLVESPSGTFGTASFLRSQRFAVSYILPNSFRSALVPFLACIPERVGLPGHGRSFMLTRKVAAPSSPDLQHQQYEMASILGVLDQRPLPGPQLNPSAKAMQQADVLLDGLRQPVVALIPGAARGPSKRWPSDSFIAVGRAIASKAGLVILGSAAERELGDAVVRGIGAGTNLAGKTDLETFAAVLSRCKVVVCNDSGGMHLAAAVGARVVAIYGLTDPGKTGPLGEGHRVIRASMQGSRDIARTDAEAERCLAELKPDVVLSAVEELLLS